MAPAPSPVILLMGPTASGKSALALELVEQFPIEIVSVDSAQIYRGMDIGTAKPDLATRSHVAHHLIDIVDPTERYSAAQFCRDARAAIDSVRARGRIPLLVGGTMLYFKALREGLSQLPPADATIRVALDERAAREGWPALHAELARIDPQTAARLPPGDSQRIQRALEVHAITGQALSQLQGGRQPGVGEHFAAFALMPPDRADLHREIAARLDTMLSAGLVDEVRDLQRRYALSESLPSMRCVGYRQVWQTLSGEHPHATLRERAIVATRQLAKRQITWLRSMEATVVDPASDSVRLLRNAVRTASSGLG